MKITVRVTPRSSREGVEPTGPNEYRVRVNAPPVEGEANAAVIRVLADHFGIPKSRVAIVRGLRGRTKLIEIL